MSNKNIHDVFISFSFKDQKIVEYIVNQLLNQYGIKYWICTRDIHAGLHYDEKITKAIKSSKVFVLIQSKSSVESNEVPKEIRLAIKFKKTIIPFVIDESEWDDGILYHLINTQEIDATRPTLDERIAELAEEIQYFTNEYDNFDNQTTGSDNVTRKLLSTSNIMPKMVFCGREDILEEIHCKLQSSDSVLFLYGIGGIGKTQIAKQYAKKHKSDYDTIVYATYNDSIKDVIIAETPFAIEPTLNRFTLSDGTQESDEAFFKRKLEIMQNLSTERTLIILDNFDVEEDENLPLLVNGKYRLLITTRCDYSRFYPTIEINPIDSIDLLKEVFMRNYQGYDVEEDDPHLVELIELVNRHTYTIELLAQHMENSGQTPAEMIAALKERGITSLDEEVRDSDMKTQVAYENLLKMFKIFSLNEEERQVLMYLSLMPTEGVDVKDFKKWADLKSPRILKNLENRSWIIKNTDGIALHPIIREVIKHEIPATEDNCSSFILFFNESITERIAWHLRKDKKDQLSNIAKSILKVLNKITENTEDLYYNVEGLISCGVDPQYAEILAERLFEYYSEKYGECSYKAGRAAFKRGWLYAYNSHMFNASKNAVTWLTKAVDILSNIELKDTDEISKLTQSQVNLAKLALLSYSTTNDNNDYLIAKHYAEQALNKSELSFFPGDVHYAKVAGAHWQLADVLLAGKELNSALAHIETALNILIPLYSEDDGDSAHAINRKAAILYAQGDYIQAKPLAEKSVQGYVNFFGENHPLVVGMYELWGDCHAALGEEGKAANAYEKALCIAEKLYAPGAHQVTDLQKKLGIR